MDDFDTVLALIPRFGGAVLDKPLVIDGVGRLAFFPDTEGNRVGGMPSDLIYPL